jgi:hypothetical protein
VTPYAPTLGAVAHPSALNIRFDMVTIASDQEQNPQVKTGQQSVDATALKRSPDSSSLARLLQ